MSPLTHIEDLKETPKTKISVVYHNDKKETYILRVCQNRDLTSVYDALHRIKNPNTVVIHDFVYENGDTYILEEYVGGSTVEEILNAKGCFSEEDTAKIVVGVCRALEELHRLKPPVIHNDINPSNIKIRDDGSVKLFDFDISRTYKKGQHQNTELFGTAEYASPEHYGYGQSEPRTDIYCLGVTMHKMLTGAELSSEHKITYKGKLKSIIKKCLEVDPKHRYRSVLELRKELERFLSSKQRMLQRMLAFLCIAAAFLAALQLYKHFDQSTADIGNGGSSIIQDGNSANISTNEVVNEPNADRDTPRETTSELSPADKTHPGNTRKNAWEIALCKNQTGVFDSNEEPHWYKFTTSTDFSAYRLELFHDPEDTRNMLMPYIALGLYDAQGIKIDEFDLWSDSEYDFLDLYLSADTEYYIKLTMGDRFYTGDYQVCVSEMPCDAGADKEHATKLTLGTTHTAVLNSTLSDWYVFEIPEDGEYTYTIHNIDVGCDIYFSKKQLNNAGEGLSIANEDNYSGNIYGLKAGDHVYFEIYPYHKDASANGTYMIVIEKDIP